MTDAGPIDLNEHDRAGLRSRVDAALAPPPSACGGVRLPQAEEPRFMSRTDKVLCSIDRSMGILELGPLTTPIAPKSDGWLTTVVDHASREQLVEKYRNDSNVDTSRIVDVDIVWSQGPLEAAVPRELHGSFDAFIASHVFEHIPDPIGLLRSLERVLGPTGVVSLVIPDKRFCFDFFRPLSTAGDLLDAHARKADRHTRKALFDQVAYSIQADGESAFSRRRLRDIDFAHSLEQAKALFDAHSVEADAPYHDVHGWVFTPSSFALAMLELSALNAIDYTVVRSFPSEGCEFYVTLRRGRVDHDDTDVLQARRLQLQRRTLEELREQAQLLDARDLNEQDRAALSSGVGATLETPRFMSRTDKVLCSIDRSMGILELGPLTTPIAPKSDGWLTTVVDHASREQLVEKYRNDRFADTSRIVDVDIVWSQGPLEAAVPRELHGSFDAFIASHVFEHIPDPIGLLRSLERVLGPTGVVSLVIPDKRFCFDFFRPLSTAGDLLDAHARKADRHTRKALFDQVAYRIQADGESAFSRRRLRDIDFDHSLEQAKALFDAHSVEADAPYHDVHGWVFTPSSFALAMLELSALNAIDYTVVRSFPSEGCEFYVTLRRGRVDHDDTDVLQARRLQLQRRTLEELGEQAQLLHEHESSPTAEATHLLRT